MANYLVFLTDCQFSKIEADDFEYSEENNSLWFKKDKYNIAFFNTQQILGFKKVEEPDEVPIFKTMGV
jgi:hypothetical protein